ncbi:MAG: cytochrome c nitrite reductase small subunit [Ignavibacteria bacterium]|nr:cytochrome c nitrite reductase small subunit [Ignavibacteria bacterium]
MRKLFLKIIPPERWKLPVIITLGILTGFAFLIFHISSGTSYLSDKPETCVNCHVMFPQYASWQHSSHARVAACSDCHVPHNNIFSKYFFKAKDGLRHTTIFTLRMEPQVIMIKDAGKEVVEENCERCHEGLMGYYHTLGNGRLDEMDEENETIRCWSCHKEVPHGKVSSLSSFPYANVPKLSPVLPDWLNKALEKK